MPLSIETKYTDSRIGRIGYQTIGDGPFDLVMSPDWTNCMELMWEDPRFESYLRELASFSRLILFDHRGCGISDPPPVTAVSMGLAVEGGAEEIEAVMDAVGSERASLLGLNLGSWAIMLFAATAPRRVRSMVLVDTSARIAAAPDYPFGATPEQLTRLVQFLKRTRGTVEGLRLSDPKAAGDPQFAQWYARYVRLSISPSLFDACWDTVEEADLRPVLPAITAPTLVIGHRDSRAYPVETGRYIAEHIPGAAFREMPGGDALFFRRSPNLALQEVREFLTGDRAEPEVDRILATILFTDIVGSTEKAAELGDRGWAERLVRHHALVRHELERFRGTEVDNAGDGFFATFDGPARAIRCAMAIRNSVES
ncbi:MAG: alpha/beta fold hydrolase, partial [Deltaproteobacteria bacterium]|nr:alpha/beta fold hydrolase [Deltaproteobacteria bacterium]